MHPQDVTDVTAVEVNGEAIDVDAELGLDEEEVQNTTGQTEKDE
jgi:hypothetical protein